MAPGVNVIFQKPNISAAARRWTVLCLSAAAVVIGVLLPAPVQRPAAGPLIRGEIQHFRLLGNPRPAPDAPFTDASGKVLRLDGFRGKVVLLNFWATWCAPCKREMPALDRLQGMLGGHRFEVVALSLDRTGLKVVGPFFEETDLKNLAVYLDPRGKVQRAFNITRFPTTVLVDPRGFEVGRLEGPAEWMAPEARALIRFFMEKQR